MFNRTANPCTPVRFRARPPTQPTEKIAETGERIALRVAHEANEERTATGTDPGTGQTRLIQAAVTKAKVTGGTK